MKLRETLTGIEEHRHAVCHPSHAADAARPELNEASMVRTDKALKLDRLATAMSRWRCTLLRSCFEAWRSDSLKSKKKKVAPIYFFTVTSSLSVNSLVLKLESSFSFSESSFSLRSHQCKSNRQLLPPLPLPPRPCAAVGAPWPWKPTHPRPRHNAVRHAPALPLSPAPPLSSRALPSVHCRLFLLMKKARRHLLDFLENALRCFPE